MSSQSTRRLVGLIRLLALLTLGLAGLTALLPVRSVYAAPILRLRLELAPGTPNPLPSGRPFTVRLTYECSSSIGTDACTNMVVESTLPAAFEGLQALGNNDVNLATYNPVTKTARWEFRSLLPLGTTGQLEFEVRYIPGTTLNGTTGTITATINSPSATPGSGTISPPPARATAQPSLTKILVAGGASDDLSLYRVALCAGTTGALALTNSTLVDTLPPGAVYVSSDPAGVHDAGTGTITWSGVDVPTSGSGCSNFDVVVTYPASDAQNAVGVLKTNGASAITTPFGGTAQSLSTTVDHTLVDPDPRLRLRKSVLGAEKTADTIVGGVITTSLTADNIGAGPAPGGNVALNTIQIIDTIPAEYDVFAISTGAATAVAYQRNGANTWITGVPLGANVAVTSFPGWAANDYVSKLSFSFAELTLTERSQEVSFQSTIVNPPNGSGTLYLITAATPRNVTNTATASAFHKTASLSDQSSSATVEIALPKARPDPRKKIISGSPALPGGTVRYEVQLRNGAFAPLLEPVIADLLPSVFTLDPASITLTKNIPGCAVQPTFTQTPDYNSSGRTLLLWSWAGSSCSLPADDDLRIEFSINVADGTRAGPYPNRLALVNYSNDPTLVRTSLCSAGGPDAALFSNGGGINPARLCFSAPSNLTVRAIASIGSAKFVQGQLDSVFHRDPIVGRTVQGGLITYQLELENTGNVDLTKLQIVDILPYKDATTQNRGVRDQSPLGTAWTVQLAGPVVVTPSIPGLSIRYSSELNPCREDFTAGPNPGCTPMVDGVAPGPGIWSTNLPSDPTAVRSLRFDFGSYALLPLGKLEFTFPAFAPVDAPVSGNGPDNIPGNSDDTNVAWNTFAYQATRADDNSTLVAQPPRVGITVRSTPANLASYGNYVWHDVNQNGQQDEPPYRGLNGVTVNLYSDTDGNLATTGDQTLVGTQITRDDVSGDPGYYLFNALQPGNYFAEFERPDGYTVTTQNNGANTSDSDIDPATLRTEITTLTVGEDDLTWDAGFYATSVSLGNRLWYDTNNDGRDNDGAGAIIGSSTGISGVAVQLFLDADGNGFLTGNEQFPIATTTTDATGFYLFTEQTAANNVPLGSPVPLFPAQYLVGIPATQFSGSAPLVGYYSSGTTMSAAGALVELAAPDPDTGPDGLAGTADDDRDHDDNGTAVRVIAGNPVPDPFNFYNGGVISKPIFVDSNEPTGEPESAGTAPGGGPIADASSNLTLDFGFYTASLGNLVWVDDGSGGGVIADGIRNGTEPGFPGATVRLYASNGTTEILVGPDGLLGTGDDATDGVTTDGNGNYSFGRLPQGSYRVIVTRPNGYVSTRDTADTNSPSTNTDNQDNGIGSNQTAATIRSNTFTLVPDNEPNINMATGSTNDPTIDFGIVRPYSLGNRVWMDTNNNGLQDTGENGIQNVTLRLLKSDGVTPAVRIDGTNVPNQTTDASGFYRFDLLPADDFIVEVLAGQFTTGDLVGYRSSTGPNQEANPNLDGDLNDNGLDMPVAGAIRSGVVSLGEGSGTLEPTNDNDPTTNPISGEAPNNQANRTVDFGFVPVYSLGNRVWRDLDNSGDLNGTEAGIDGVTVRLLTSTGAVATDVDGIPVVDQVTAGGGYYRFDNLLAGDYIVEVVSDNFASSAVLANHFSSTGPNQEANPNLDRDRNDNGLDLPVAGAIRSGVVTLGPTNSEPTNDNDPTTNPEAGEAPNNRANRTVDFGFITPLSLGDLIFHDRDNNGQYDPAIDSPLPGATVELLDSLGNSVTDVNGTAVGPQITTDGSYLFINLLPGDYTVRVTPPTDYRSSDDIVGSATPNNDENDDDNGLGSTSGAVTSASITLTSGAEPDGGGESNLTLDFGFYQPLSLGDLIFHDRDNNGQYDPAIDSPLPGATVTLYLDDGVTRANNADGVELPELTTGTDGIYGFANLNPGDYTVRVTPPTGYRSSDDIVGSATPNNDENNDDNGLGNSTLGAASSAPITLSSGEEPQMSGLANLTLDFGFYQPLSLGDLVFEDFANDGRFNNADVPLPGATVELLFADGSPATDVNGVTVDSQTTGANGRYLFNNLKPGDYLVRVTAPAGYSSSDDLIEVTDYPNNDRDDDDNGVNNFESIDNNRTVTSNRLTLRSGDEPDDDGDGNASNLTLDFGFFRPSALGDRVWLDLNRNGIQDAAELAGVPGVTVILYAADGTTEIQRTTTDSDGLYRFEQLGAGNYIIAFELPLGYAHSLRGGTPDSALDSNADPGTGRTALINLPTATTDLSWDAGIYYTAGLGNRVWLDRNANGLQDSGELGVPNVVVTLYAADGVSVVRTTSTDASGFYFFDNLAPGDYQIAFIPPSGYELSQPNQGSNRDGDSDADAITGRTGLISLAPNQADPSWDAGLFQRVRLGNLVWEDSNNNGLVDVGEPGLANLSISLFADTNGDGQPDGAAIATTTTDADGRYQFAKLLPGDYLVELASPTGYVSSTGMNGATNGSYEPAPGPNNNRDNDDNGTRFNATTVRSGVITLLSQSEPDAAVDGDDTNGNLTVDFGFFRPAGLGSLVWYDSNGDGHRSDGEPGAAGVRVSLRYADGTPVRDAASRPLSVITNADGNYFFDYLTPGSYQVSFDNLPRGYTFTAPGGNSDADPLTGLSPSVSLQAGERNLSLWAGLINPTAISLISFSATPDASGIMLRWATADERNSWGFHLLRSADGSRVSAVRVTPQHLRAHGESQSGDSYSWIDTSAAPGVRYSYWLQEIEIGGRINEYGPATATLSLNETGFRILLPLVQR